MVRSAMTDLAQAPTIVHRFLHRVQQDGDRPALHVKRSGQFRTLTWQQLADDVLRLAQGLADLGIAAGDRVALWAENSYEWILADLAIQLVRAVHVPLHASLAPAQVLQQLEHSQASVLLVATESLLARLAPIETRLPLPLQVVSLTPAPAALPQGRPVRAGRPWLHRRRDGGSARPDRECSAVLAVPFAGHDSVYVRHDRPTQRCDAQPG